MGRGISCGPGRASRRVVDAYGRDAVRPLRNAAGVRDVPTGFRRSWRGGERSERTTGGVGTRAQSGARGGPPGGAQRHLPPALTRHATIIARAKATEVGMNTLIGYRRIAEGTDPPYDYAAYVSTHKRAPRYPLVRLAHTISEITGPRFVPASMGSGDADLTRFGGGEALGERIVVTGRVLDEDDR